MRMLNAGWAGAALGRRDWAGARTAFEGVARAEGETPETPGLRLSEWLDEQRRGWTPGQSRRGAA